MENTTDHELISIVLGVSKWSRSLIIRSSEQERRVDARALIADEGRDKLR